MQEIGANIIRSDSLQLEKFCKYIHRYCHQPRIDGYNYCIRHILEDKLAPFRQCSFINQTNKKRCPNAASLSENTDKNSLLCFLHTKQNLPKEKAPVIKVKSPQGPPALLKSLEHYCKDPAHDKRSRRQEWVTTSEPPTTLNQVEAVFDANDDILAKTYIDTVDDEFVWSDKATVGHCLDNAGIYTHKDILRITRDKIQRLQELYFEEVKVVCQQMKENRREFLLELKKLKHASGNSQNFAEEKFKALKALSRYRFQSGAHNLLRQRSKRAKAGLDEPSAELSKCDFMQNETKCQNTVLPLSKFCTTHILSEPKQVLFSPCGLGRNCQKPIVAFEDNPSCSDHFGLTLKKSVIDSDRPSTSTETIPESEPFQSMDDIASLGLDAIAPGSLFGLDQFGDPGESTDTVPSDDEDPFRNSLNSLIP